MALHLGLRGRLLAVGGLGGALLALPGSCGGVAERITERVCEPAEGGAEDSETALDVVPPDSPESLVPACRELDPCVVVGTSCTNLCGLGCECAEVDGKKRVHCPRPVEGSPCDPEVNAVACQFPFQAPTDPSDASDAQQFHGVGGDCRCESPALEPFWICNLDDEATVCPIEKPVPGASCALLPAGLWCFYDEGVLTKSCMCTRHEDVKTWSCGT
jgi:hypothetical protein